MSTSPSWFDQEKFSRLVKKVGPKAVTGALPSVSAPTPSVAAPASEPEARPQSLASTAHISLVSKPSLMSSESRALPALPRRTTPLPTLKALFSQTPATRYSPVPSQPSPEPETPTETFPASEEIQAEETPEAEAPHNAEEDAPNAAEGEDLNSTWEQMNQLHEELARAIQERDQAMSEGVILREQLRQAEDAGGTQSEPSESEDVDLLTEERDQARREYAALREEFETLKQEQPSRQEAEKRDELDQELDELREKLEERDKEIADLKASVGSTGSSGDTGGEDVGDGKLKQEVASLREQLVRAKEDASNAQRGLILSQKALQETRDTLREATEGTSLSRHNFDNLKTECATLAQQNTVLQAQIEQLTRDLATAKSKSTGRL